MNENEKKYRRVAVLKGGISSEREVSLRSGAAVARGLSEAGYDIVEVNVTDTRPLIPEGIEAAFIALHGEFGEDGGIQQYLADKGIPYTGAGIESSKNSFSKIATKQIFEKQGIPTPRYEVLKNGMIPRIPIPAVVKPVHGGSSLGVNKILKTEDWNGTLEDALKYDSAVLVEEFIEGTELTVGIIGSEALPIIEIRAPGDWYGYGAKYTAGKTEYLVPAPIDEKIAQRCKDASLKAYNALHCKGFGRVDIRLSRNGIPYVLELNTIPGFTETSLLPKAAAYAGISFPDLCERILTLAEVINT